MSFIEGIGDEVTLFFVIIVVFFLAAVITLIGNSPTLSSTRARQRWRLAPELENESIYVLLFLLREVGVASALTREGVNYTRNSPNPALHDDQHINNDDTLNNSSGNQTVHSEAVRNLETDAEISTSNNASNVEDSSTSAHNVTHETAEQHNSESAQASSAEENATTELPCAPQDEIRVRLKYLDDTEKTVTTSLNTNIGDFKRKHFQDDIRSNKIVRLIFAGHLLKNSSTIQSCRILDNSVVHVQVLPAPTTQSAPIVNQETELDLAWILWPVLTVILSLCWLTYFKYPEFYNSLSLGILLLFSGCYFYFLSRIRH